MNCQIGWGENCIFVWNIGIQWIKAKLKFVQFGDRHISQNYNCDQNIYITLSLDAEGQASQQAMYISKNWLH